jgi:hypothetical protein
MNTANYIITREKTKQSPYSAEYRKYTGALKTAANKREILDPPKSQYFMDDGTVKTYDIDNMCGWTQEPWEIGQKLVVVGHFEPTFASTYCSAELRIDTIYKLPEDPVPFKWPDTPMSPPSRRSAASTPKTTPVKRKFDFKTDF